MEFSTLGDNFNNLVFTNEAAFLPCDTLMNSESNDNEKFL